MKVPTPPLRNAAPGTPATRTGLVGTALLLAFALAGCGPTPDSVDNVPYRYQCSEAQMQKASSETLFCKKESGFTDTYCYGSAIMRNCEPKRAVVEEKR